MHRFHLNDGYYHALYRVMRTEFQNNSYTLEDKYLNVL
jgi:hypothetical protein